MIFIYASIEIYFAVCYNQANYRGKICMKYLYKMNWQKLQSLFKYELCLDGWSVFNTSIYKRMDNIRTYKRYDIMKLQADNSGLRYNDIEIATWFDTLSILYYAFDGLDDEHLRDNIIILQEYNIPYSNKRADYLLCYDNKILILEFSFHKLGYELQYETKLHQAIGYKELISNVLPKEVDVGTYTFLVDSGCISNDDKVYDLSEYIEKFFNKNIDLAIRSLSHLDDEECEDSDKDNEEDEGKETVAEEDVEEVEQDKAIESNKNLPVNELYQTFLNLQAKFPNNIVFFIHNGYYKTCNENAFLLSKEYDLSIYARDYGLEYKQATIEIPAHSNEFMFGEFIKNHSFIIIDNTNIIKYALNEGTGEITELKL